MSVAAAQEQVRRVETALWLPCQVVGCLQSVGALLQVSAPAEAQALQLADHSVYRDRETAAFCKLLPLEAHPFRR